MSNEENNKVVVEKDNQKIMSDFIEMIDNSPELVNWFHFNLQSIIFDSIDANSVCPKNDGDNYSIMLDWSKNASKKFMKHMFGVII